MKDLVDMIKACTLIMMVVFFYGLFGTFASRLHHKRYPDSDVKPMFVGLTWPLSLPLVLSVLTVDKLLEES